MSPNPKKGDGHQSQAFPFSPGELPETVRLQIEAWFKDQADLLEGMQNLMGTWMKRRREGTEAAFRTFERMCSCGDVGDAVTAYNEWLSGSMGRIMADMSTLRDEAIRMARISQKMAMPAAARESAAEVEAAADDKPKPPHEHADPRVRRIS